MVRKTLHSTFPVFPMLKNYCSWEWKTLFPDILGRVGSAGEETILIETIPVSKKPPLYTKSNEEVNHLKEVWEVGLVLQNEKTGKSLAYFPTLEEISPAIEASLMKADIMMVDGTFWSKGELVEIGATKRDAQNMGHLPIGGRGGTAEKLAGFPAERKILIHINNSNPILKMGSLERNTLESLGFEVAFDGMEVEV